MLCYMIYILDFEYWKGIIEKREDCLFFKLIGDKRNLEIGIIVKYFQCNRGGFVKMKGEGF